MSKHTQYAPIEYLCNPITQSWINKSEDFAEYKQAKAEHRVRAGCQFLQAIVIGLVFGIPLFIQIAKECR